MNAIRFVNYSRFNRMLKNLIKTISIILFLASCSSQDDTVIAIQPFKGFLTELTDSVENAIQRFYGFQTICMQPVPIPESYFVNIKSPRYRADSLIRYLKKTKPKGVDFVTGLCMQDISTTKRDKFRRIKKPESKYRDWGIFGLGYRPGPSCVVSTFRIFSAGKAKNIKRLQKVCLHELGHNLGIPHCPDADCFMRDANETIKTIDFVEVNLCVNCQARIHKFRFQ